jgi:hypothetical protein
MSPHHRLTQQLLQGSQPLKRLLALTGSRGAEDLPADVIITTTAAAEAAAKQEGSQSHWPVHTQAEATASCCR